MPPLTGQPSGQLNSRRGFLRPQLQAVGPAPLTHSPSHSQPHHGAHGSHGPTSDGVSQSGCPTAGNHTSPLSGAGEALVLWSAAYICVAWFMVL